MDDDPVREEINRLRCEADSSSNLAEKYAKRAIADALELAVRDLEMDIAAEARRTGTSPKEVRAARPVRHGRDVERQRILVPVVADAPSRPHRCGPDKHGFWDACIDDLPATVRQCRICGKGWVALPRRIGEGFCRWRPERLLERARRHWREHRRVSERDGEQS